MPKNRRQDDSRRPRRPAPPGPREPREPRTPTGLRLVDLDEIELTVDQIVDGGEGLGRFEGIPIFVPRSAPGDRVRARLTDRRPDYGRAEVVELLEPGPGRRPPPCPFFERCGGCDLQHLDQEHQLRFKAAAVRETLARLGGVEMPAQVAIVAGDVWGYRLRAQLHVGWSERGRQVGYFARGSHDLVAVDRCPILVGELERELPRLPEALRHVEHRRIDVAAGDGEAWTVAPLVPGLPHGEVTAQVGETTYAYDARCFFQGHRQLLPDLVEHAVGDGGGELALDLYAGVGLFALPLARRHARVIAVEGDRIAARYARTNARRNKLANVEVEATAVDGWLRRPGNWELAPSRVVVDPPRGGLSSPLRRWLAERRPARLTYVSCHAATLARDLRALTRAFRVDRIALLDLFPQTGHMEVVVQMSDADRDPPKSSPPTPSKIPPFEKGRQGGFPQTAAAQDSQTP